MTGRGTIPQEKHLGMHAAQLLHCTPKWKGLRNLHLLHQAPSQWIQRGTEQLVPSPMVTSIPRGWQCQQEQALESLPMDSQQDLISWPWDVTSAQAQVGMQLLKVPGKSGTSSPSLHPSGAISKGSRRNFHGYSLVLLSPGRC